MSSQIAAISVTSQPSRERLKQLGVFNWSIPTKEVSEFSWSYDEAETCYFLADDVVVTLNSGKPVTMGQGDLVTFPVGMSCTWKINSTVKKHYKFGWLVS